MMDAHETATPERDAVIQMRALSKDYGNGRGVFGIDLDVHRGEVLGFIGPNGAGKSTTLRCLLGLLKPTAGEVRVRGFDPWLDGPEMRTEIGYLPGELSLWSNRTGRGLLEDLARLRGGRGHDRIATLAKRLGLDLDTLIRRLSKGNKQKLGIAQAFMHEPRLLILDEPTDGLDPLLRREVHGLIREARDTGRTVFLSSHVIHEVEQVCDRVALIRNGRLLMVRPLQEMRQELEHWLVVRFQHPVPAKAFEGLGRVQTRGGIEYRFTDADWDRVAKAVAAYPIASLRADNQPLEDAILYLYREETE